MATLDDYEARLALLEQENDALRTLLSEDERFFHTFLDVLESATDLGPMTNKLLALLRARSEALDKEAKE